MHLVYRFISISKVYFGLIFQNFPGNDFYCSVRTIGAPCYQHEYTDVMLKLLCAVSFYMYVLFFAFLSLVSYTFVDWSSCLNPVKKTPYCFVPARVVVV